MDDSYKRERRPSEIYNCAKNVQPSQGEITAVYASSRRLMVYIYYMQTNFYVINDKDWLNFPSNTMSGWSTPHYVKIVAISIRPGPYRSDGRWVEVVCIQNSGGWTSWRANDFI